MQPLLLVLAHMTADTFCHQSRISDDFSMKIIIITMLIVILGCPLNDHTASCLFLWNSGHLYFELLDICAADNSVWLSVWIICVGTWYCVSVCLFVCVCIGDMRYWVRTVARHASIFQPAGKELTQRELASSPHFYTAGQCVNTQIVSAGSEEGNRVGSSQRSIALAEEGHDISTHVMNDNLLI